MYIITGKRSNGETVFVCSSATQGRRIVPYAHSMAEGFAVRSQASEAMASVSAHYKGIVFRMVRNQGP